MNVQEMVKELRAIRKQHINRFNETGEIPPEVVDSLSDIVEAADDWETVYVILAGMGIDDFWSYFSIACRPNPLCKTVADFYNHVHCDKDEPPSESEKEKEATLRESGEKIKEELTGE